MHSLLDTTYARRECDVLHLLPAYALLLLLCTARLPRCRWHDMALGIMTSSLFVTTAQTTAVIAAKNLFIALILPSKAQTNLLYGCRYSEAGLKGLINLKNKDRAVALVLKQLAEAGLIDVHIVFIHKHEMGTGEGYDGNWSMGDVCDTDYKAQNWMRLNGTKAGLKAVDIGADDILQVEAVTHGSSCQVSHLCEQCLLQLALTHVWTPLHTKLEHETMSPSCTY